MIESAGNFCARRALNSYKWRRTAKVSTRKFGTNPPLACPSSKVKIKVDFRAEQLITLQPSTRRHHL
jgi:hypothetical protein